MAYDETKKPMEPESSSSSAASDEKLKGEAKTALAQDPSLSDCDFEVDVKAGTLTLSGTVESQDQKQKAEIALKAVSGITTINNQVTVKKYGSEKASEKTKVA